MRLVTEIRELQERLISEGHTRGWEEGWARTPGHAEPRTMLWLKRSRRRFMANESSLLSAAHSAGLDVIWPRGGKLGELLALLGQADIVFLPHGADGANLVMMQPCTLVVQLCPCGYQDSGGCRNHYFGNLVQNLGGSYLAAHLRQDQDPVSQRECEAGAKNWPSATMFASEPFLTALFARARDLYRQRFGDCDRPRLRLNSSGPRAARHAATRRDARGRPAMPASRPRRPELGRAGMP